MPKNLLSICVNFTLATQQKIAFFSELRLPVKRQFYGRIKKETAEAVPLKVDRY